MERINRQSIWIVCCLILTFCWVSMAEAQSRRKKSAPEGTPLDYRSNHFLLHTDLPPKEAEALLKRLETMLSLISTYWGRPPSGIIEEYVVKDLKNWPNATTMFPPESYIQLEAKAGVCLTRTISSGDRFMAKSIAYAYAKSGIAQHEAVHAYCHQTFGRVGPSWYAEGMAEMGQYWNEGEKAVNAHPHVIKFLRESPPKPLAETIQDFRPVGDTWEEYAWRWALCHLLANNPNYAPRFRPLGLGILTQENVSFEQVYGPVAKELSFEYLFFLDHVEKGYRVDLCAWDWKKKFLPRTSSSGSVTANLLPARGWQPSGLTMTAGTTYEYTATGKWKTGKSRPMLTADGADDGTGRLMGILMKEYRLSRPFELGISGTLKFSVDGNLYLRCNDAWNELDDNSGRVSFRIKKSRGK